ncbi:MAG: NAD(P)-dependent oxidoreductase [Victivallales bacterium]|jgi:nucleoside-diphosphate-sugar epimerase
MKHPYKIESEEALDALLSIPGEGLADMMKRLDGDIMILGIGGKMGVTLGLQAVNAVREAGACKKIIGVSRFTDQEGRRKLEENGIETIPCDLLDRRQVERLPQVKNIIYMAGRKFGIGGSENVTWAMNTMIPTHVGTCFRESRIVVFSTGCVYPLVSVKNGGCTEDVKPEPVGEYAQSCLGRERVFEYCSNAFGTKVLLFRLNYAVDLRYGVLHDIGGRIWTSQPVCNTVGHFNIIWQGDANCYALRCLEHCASPAVPVNITGPETVSVKHIAGKFADFMGKDVSYSGVNQDKCYLNNASKSFELFGRPRIGLEDMIRWQAEWIMRGGSSLGKPTHFEVNDGKF